MLFWGGFVEFLRGIFRCYVCFMIGVGLDIYVFYCLFRVFFVLDFSFSFSVCILWIKMSLVFKRSEKMSVYYLYYKL